MHRQSVLFSSTDIGSLPGGGQHVVAYHPDLSRGWLCSEPTRIVTHRIDSVNEEGDRALKEAEMARVADVAREVTESVSSLRRMGWMAWRRLSVAACKNEEHGVRRDTPQAEEAGLAAEELLVARDLARVGFGVDFMLAQSRD